MTDASAVCYVICWQYSDRSAYGLVGYSFVEADALAILKLLQDHAETRQFHIAATPKLPKP